MQAVRYARTRYGRVALCIGAAVAAALLSLQVIPGLAPGAAWPAISPYLALGVSVAARSATLLTLAAVPLLLVALWRGRWFCHRLCPTGLLLLLFGRLGWGRASRLRRVPRLGGLLGLVMAGGAAAGYPLLLWLDPLVQFNGLFSAVREANWTWRAALPAAPLGLVCLAVLFWPQIWCERLCPLGALQAGLGRLGCAGRQALARRRAPAPGADGPSQPAYGPRIGRRGFLALAGGAGAGWLLRRASASPGPAAVVRPPGARSEPDFQALCARCGACLRACPHQVIVPDLGASGWGGWLTPRLDFSRRYCSEWCRACTDVCPTGALARLSLDAKREPARALGTARVDRARCLAWHDGEYCMVCQEYCPFQAIRGIEHRSVHCPEVDPAQCRGCGACESQCPAGRVRAIRVEGRSASPP